MNAYAMEVPPDPLRRFLPTEHRVEIHAPRGVWTLETNDASLVFMLAQVAKQIDAVGELGIRIVRDSDVQAREGELMIVDDGTVVVASTGQSCVLAYDRELKRLVGFCAADLNVNAIASALAAVFGCTKSASAGSEI